jgi:probable rRNA maturation factor
MNYHIFIQHASSETSPIDDEKLMLWGKHTLAAFCKQGEFTLRIVDTQEMIALNHNYRNINKKTNVLAFPATYPKEITLAIPFLGDVVICPNVLQEESITQQVPLEAHWAHILLHGILHLLGYDHINEDDAKEMQSIEIKLLLELGFRSPYLET